MWTKSDWRRLRSSPPPSINSFRWFFILILFAKAFVENSTYWYLFSLFATTASFIYPIWLMPLNFAWYLLGISLAWCFQPIFLMLLYFFFITPIGLIHRVFSKKEKRGSWVARTKPFRFEKMF